MEPPYLSHKAIRNGCTFCKVSDGLVVAAVKTTPCSLLIFEIIDLKFSYGLLKETRLITFLGTFGQWHGVEVFAKSIVDLVNNHLNFLEKCERMETEPRQIHSLHMAWKEPGENPYP